MNQKRNFAKRIADGSPVRLNVAQFSWILLPLCVFLINHDHVLAQGSFVSNQNNGSANGQWSPPGSQPSRVFRASGEQAIASPPAGASFPETAVEFDSGVRIANLETPTANNLNAENSVKSTLDSTASMLSNLKNATSEQLSGLAASLKQDGGWTEKVKSVFGSSDISRMLGSLTFVLGIYFAFVWVMRKINPAGNAGLPAEVIEVMGQVPFGPKRNLQLVRLGSKLLLLINSPEGTQPIGEITDPNEVQYLASLCPGKRKKSGGSNAAIQQAASRIASAVPTPASVSTQAPAQPTTPVTAPAPITQSNLANILRTLDQAAKQNTAIFEA